MNFPKQEFRDRFDQLMPFDLSIIDISRSKSSLLPLNNPDAFVTSLTSSRVSLFDRPLVDWLVAASENQLTASQIDDLKHFIEIQISSEEMGSLSSLPKYFDAQLRSITSILSEKPEYAGHYSFFQSNLFTHRPLFIRNLLGNLGLADEFSKSEYDESIPVVEKIIILVNDTLWTNIPHQLAREGSERRNYLADAVQSLESVLICLLDLDIDVSRFPHILETLQEVGIKNRMDMVIDAAKEVGLGSERILRIQERCNTLFRVMNFNTHT